MIKRLQLLFIAVCLVNSPVTYCMEKKSDPVMEVIKFQVTVPLRPGRTTKKVTKSVLVKVPDNLSGMLQAVVNQHLKTSSMRSSDVRFKTGKV